MAGNIKISNLANRFSAPYTNKKVLKSDNIFCTANIASPATRKPHMEHLVALYGPAPCGTLRTPVETVLSVLMASDGSIQAPGTGGNAVNSWDLSDGPLSPLVGKHGHNLAQFSMGKIWKNRTSLSRFSTFSDIL